MNIWNLCMRLTFYTRLIERHTYLRIYTYMPVCKYIRICIFVYTPLKQHILLYVFECLWLWITEAYFLATNKKIEKRSSLSLSRSLSIGFSCSIYLLTVLRCFAVSLSLLCSKNTCGLYLLFLLMFRNVCLAGHLLNKFMSVFVYGCVYMCVPFWPK